MKTLLPRIMFLVIVLYSVNLAAQKTKDNGLTMTLINYGAMRQGNDVKGYYSFYKVDKADRKNNNYEIKIYDDNFNDVNDFDIVKPVQYTLQEATYNGEAFCFVFLDEKEKRQNLISYDKNGKQIKDYFYEPMDAQEFAAYSNTHYGSKANGNVTINAMPGKGFLKFDDEHDKKEKKSTYSVTLFSNDLKKVWTVTPPITEQHKYEGLLPAYYDDKYLIGVVMAKDKMMGTDISYEVVAIDLVNGKRLFQKPLKDSRYSVVPSGAFYDYNSQQIVLLGEYTDAQNKTSKGVSNGLAMIGLDETGATKTQKYLSWDKDVNKFLNMDSRGKIQDGGFIGFEKMFTTADGKIFAVGEQYRKAASGMGIAAAVLSGGRSVGATAVVNIKVMDLMVFEFEPDFSIKKVSSYDKVDRQVDLPGTLAYFPLDIVSIFMKAYGLFDYNFLTLSNDKNSFAINYNIHAKKNGDPINIGNLIYTPEGTLVENKVELKQKPDMYAVFPAKWGYLGLLEYNKKEKKVDTRVEKLDY